jgi:hypothetical protein
MKYFYSILVALSLMACSTGFAQTGIGYRGYYDDALYYGFRLSLVAPGEVHINLTVPANFPNPSYSVGAILDCKHKTIRPPERYGIKDSKTFDSMQTFISETNDITFDNGNFSVRNISVTCKDDAVSIRAPSIGEAIGLIAGSQKQGLGSERGELRLRVYDGYRFPTIREGFYFADVYVVLSREFVTSRTAQMPLQDAVVAIRQGETWEPVLFEMQRYEVPFNSHQPALLAINRGRLAATKDVWDYIEFHYDDGLLTWWQSSESP